MNTGFLLRPSASEKWVNCPASARLEHGLPNIYKESAKEGVYAHEVAEWCLKNKKKPEHSPYQISKGMCKHINSYVNYVNKVSQYKKLFVEYSISLKPLGIDHYGKIDSLCITQNIIHIIDFKYGKWPVEVINNYQLLMYAYGVYSSKALIFNDVQRITLSVFQPRVKRTLSSWDLNENEFIENIKPIQKAVYQANLDSPPYVPGTHCMFCKAKNICPIKPKNIEFKKKIKFEDESYG